MFDLLRQPYPLETEAAARWRAVLISGLVVGLFLFVFRPFGINDTPVANLTAFIWGYGLVTAVTVAAGMFVGPALLPGLYNEERWTVGKNILLFLVIVFFIGAANWFYTHAFAGLPLAFDSFLVFQFYTLSVSVVVASAGTLFRYALNLKQYQSSAQELSHALHETGSAATEALPQPVVLPTPVTLRSATDKDEITVTPETFLYVESADNYSDVCFLENGLVQHRLIRSSLKRVEDLLSQPFAFRCHRSFIVNLYKVESVTGNSQGYKLHVRDADKTIPVARRLNDELSDRLKSAKPFRVP